MVAKEEGDKLNFLEGNVNALTWRLEGKAERNLYRARSLPRETNGFRKGVVEYQEKFQNGKFYWMAPPVQAL